MPQWDRKPLSVASVLCCDGKVRANPAYPCGARWLLVLGLPKRRRRQAILGDHPRFILSPSAHLRQGCQTLHHSKQNSDGYDKQLYNLEVQLRGAELPTSVAEPTLAQRRTVARAAARKEAAACDKDRLLLLVNEQAARQQSPARPASERLAALKERLAAKWAAAQRTATSSERC